MHLGYTEDSFLSLNNIKLLELFPSMLMCPSGRPHVEQFPKRVTTLNAGFINGTCNLTPLNAKSFTQQGKKSDSYTSTLFTNAYRNLYLQRKMSTSLQTYHGIRTLIAFLKRQTTHLAFLGETSRYTPNH